MSRTKTANKEVRYFFLLSLAIHAVFLFCLGRSILSRRCERRIEVDLRPFSSARPVRNIPQPYRRPKADLETKDIKPPITPLSPRHVPAPIRPAIQKSGFSPKAAKTIHVPAHDECISRNGSIIGEIKGVEIPQVQTTIKVAHDGVDQTMAYRGIIRRRIEQHKSFPLLAVKRGLEGKVGIRFLLRRNGQIEEIEVTKSSGIPMLDDTAEGAVRKGVPFPPFPEGISDDCMIIEVTLHFELMRGAL